MSSWPFYCNSDSAGQIVRVTGVCLAFCRRRQVIGPLLLTSSLSTPGCCGLLSCGAGTCMAFTAGNALGDYRINRRLERIRIRRRVLPRRLVGPSSEGLRWIGGLRQGLVVFLSCVHCSRCPLLPELNLLLQSTRPDDPGANPMTVCETERLRLSTCRSDDAPFILELLNDPGFIQNIGDRGVRSSRKLATT